MSSPSTNTPQPALYTEQAATFLGLAESSLEKMRCYGGGPKFIKMGKRVTYRLQDLEAYQSERVMASTSEYQPTKAA